jgi:hypothetical protein
MDIIQYIFCNVYLTMCILQCISYHAYCKMNTFQCIFYNVYPHRTTDVSLHDRATMRLVPLLEVHQVARVLGY